jgi:hypothetical protein
MVAIESLLSAAIFMYLQLMESQIWCAVVSYTGAGPTGNVGFTGFRKSLSI